MADNSLIRGRQDLAEARELERYLCQTDLKYLCTQKLGFEDWDICHDEFQTWYAHNHDKFFKIILIPRNHLKSSIITIAQTIQDVLNNHNTKILIASAVWDNARSFLDEIKEYLEKSDLPELFGTFKGTKWNKDEVTVQQRRLANKTPTIDTAGIEKVLTSQHYDIIRADDLVTRETVATKDQMQKVKNFHNDLLKLVHPKHGRVEVIGTHWHYADLYAELLEENKLRFERGEPEKYSTYIKGCTDTGDWNGKPIFPKMFTVPKLKDIEFSIGSSDFACNYWNVPNPVGTRIFKPPIRYWNDVSQIREYYITVDLANEDGQDYVVVLVGGLTGANQLCIVEYARGHFGHNETIEKVFNFVVKYMTPQKSRKVAIESVAFQKVMSRLVEEEQRKRNIFFEIIKIIPHKEKEFRIRGLQPRWESGNLLLKQGMVELEDEIEKFPVGKHDDILDAVEMLLHIIDPMSIAVKPSRTYVPKHYRR